MVERKIIVNILPGNVFFIQQHQCSGLQHVLPVIGPQRQVIQIRLGRYKDIFDLAQRIKMNMVITLRLSDQSQVDLIFPEKLEGVIGGLTFNSDRIWGC